MSPIVHVLNRPAPVLNSNNPVPNVVKDPMANDSEATKCKVCLERDVNVVLQHCGHACCDTCLPSLKSCPHCRGIIVGHMKVFLFN